MGPKHGIAMYGSVGLQRGYCGRCECYALIVDGQLQCCDAQVTTEPSDAYRMSEAAHNRKGPSARERYAILKNQENRCLYCLRRFGVTVFRGLNPIMLRVTWDHAVPYTYCRANPASNFVGACQVCNKLKSSSIFDTVDEVRLYVEIKWREKGYSDKKMRTNWMSGEL